MPGLCAHSQQPKPQGDGHWGGSVWQSCSNPLQRATAHGVLSGILYATVVCKFKSGVMTGKFKYNVN